MTTASTTVETLLSGPPATTTPTATIREAAADLAGEYRGLLLVTGPHGLLGVLSERDVVRAIGEGEDPDDIRVEHVMTDDVVTIQATASIDEALALMEDNQIRHLVVARGQVPVGLVSMRDVLHVATRPTVVDVS